MPTATIKLRQDDDILTIDEGAKILQVTKRTVFKFLKSGDLRAHKISYKLVRIFRKDVNAFLQRYATTSRE
jgi:excisionase family DNA binding protein